MRTYLIISLLCCVTGAIAFFCWHKNTINAAKDGGQAVSETANVKPSDPRPAALTAAKTSVPSTESAADIEVPGQPVCTGVKRPASADAFKEPANPAKFLEPAERLEIERKIADCHKETIQRLLALGFVRKELSEYEVKISDPQLVYVAEEKSLEDVLKAVNFDPEIGSVELTMSPSAKAGPSYLYRMPSLSFVVESRSKQFTVWLHEEKKPTP